MEKANVSLAEILRLARERTGLTQEELSASSGVSVRTISHLECGAVARPRAATVRRLAVALHLDQDTSEKLHMISRAHSEDLLAALSRAGFSASQGSP
ncbi:hypothetical protein GCM10009665_26820 [Kitasatospora nipponensis]|uniref:HTH cro/C1-type domain-containing protein n=1 Tax=Kitasatospora nipponensis TaxID=258049 RepID=A0ABP4GSJ7_9ACTN